MPDLRVLHDPIPEEGNRWDSEPTPKDIFDWLLGCETCGRSGKDVTFTATPNDSNGDSWNVEYDPCPDCQDGRRIRPEVVEATAKARYERPGGLDWEICQSKPLWREDAEADLFAAVEAWEADNA